MRLLKVRKFRRSSVVLKPASGKLRKIVIGTVALGVCAGLGYGSWHWTRKSGPFASKQLLTKDRLAMVLSDSASFYQFPGEIELPLDDLTTVPAVVQYAFDPKLQDEMENLFRLHRPDYGAFVAMDATTGRILSMVSFSQKDKIKENLALRATFPSASVFKVVTAAAAIEKAAFSSETVIPFNGANHTLYKGNILKDRTNRWTRHMTLKDAFAKSVNTVFGKIGAFTVGAEELKSYADRFGFNRRIAADIPIQEGRAAITGDPADSFGIAEIASGYTRDNTMSPLQGALIAATIANNGVMMEPYAVQSVFTQDGNKIYSAEPKVSSAAVDPQTAAEVRELMKQTVTSGTSQRSFRKFFRGQYAALTVGGKTGSLSGTDPVGKYDWFVGFADSGNQKIAVAALAIHEKYWRVKSSWIARRAFEIYFDGRLGEQHVADVTQSSSL